MVNFDSDCRVKIAEDSMSATLYLTPASSGTSYTVDDLTDFLRHNGVNGCISFSTLENIIKSGLYYREVEVAKGSAPVHGKNGWYEFLFVKEEIKHPLIRSDGSVDYQSMSVIHNIRKGDTLAVYHPAVPGVHGMDVRGRTFRAKPGKELPQIRGTGFDRSFDGNTYTATAEGKIEYDNYKLYVRDVYEYRGDLNLVVGRIDFRGDVIIHGNVCAGTQVRASKSITVDGSVESATLIAEGDIILKKGMQGGKRAKIICGGTVYANFVEFTSVEAKGNIEANIIMNSQISAGKSIVISGKRGAVVGGSSYAVGMIRATFLGNAAGVKTVAAVGISKELERRNHLLLIKASSARESIEKTMTEIQKYRDSRIMTESKEVREAKLSQLNRRKLRDERLLEHIERELKEIEGTIQIANAAKVCAIGTAYRSVLIMIDDKEKQLQQDMKNAEFYRKSLMDEISIRPAGV